MSDSEIIIESLRKVERRLRRNRLCKDFLWALALFLIFPLAFKAYDLFIPLTGITVVIAVGIWFAALAVYSASLLRQKGTLAQAAAAVDKRLALHDELKTAFWFIENPRASEWVEVQIERAAKSAQKVDVDRLYPRAVPNTLYFAAGMLVVVVGLNFVPSSQNHNWLALEAATPNSVEDQNLDLTAINEGLDEIARDLERSDELKEAADALLNRNLLETAAQFRDVAQDTGTTSPEALREMQRSLEQAAEHSRPGLEKLSEDLKQAATGLERQDHPAAEQALERVAQDLEELSRRMEDQLIRNEITQRLKDAAGSAPGDRAGEVQETQQGAGWMSPLPDGRMPKNDAPPGNNPFGLEPSGDAIPNPPRFGPATSLKVQLEREKLTGQQSEVKREDLEKASKEERSKIDYRNVESNLRPAQKDVLNQDWIPGKYRPLIKSYFQSIRPAE